MKSRVIRLLLVLAVFNLTSARIQSSILAGTDGDLQTLSQGQEGKKPPEKEGAGRDRENPPEKSPAEPPKDDGKDDQDDPQKRAPTPIKPPMKHEPPLRTAARLRLSLRS